MYTTAMAPSIATILPLRKSLNIIESVMSSRVNTVDGWDQALCHQFSKTWEQFCNSGFFTRIQEILNSLITGFWGDSTPTLSVVEGAKDFASRLIAISSSLRLKLFRVGLTPPKSGSCFYRFMFLVITLTAIAFHKISTVENAVL